MELLDCPLELSAHAYALRWSAVPVPPAGCDRSGLTTGHATIAGADAIATVEQTSWDLLAQVYAYREVSSNLAHDDV